MFDSSFLQLREIGILTLREQEEIHFSIDVYRGYRYVSVRRYVREDNFSGPTKDGVTLTPEIVRAFVPRLLALPANAAEVKLGPVGKFAKRPGICIVATIVEIGTQRGLELRQWEQDKGFARTGLLLPLTQWAEIRKLFQDTLAALDEMPDVDF